VREAALVTVAQNTPKYAPAITFHWGGRVARKFIMLADGSMGFATQVDAADFTPIITGLDRPLLLWSGFVSAATITLNNDMGSFKSICIIFDSSAGMPQKDAVSIPVDSFVSNPVHGYMHHSYVWYGSKAAYISSTQIAVSIIGGTYGVREVWGVY